MRSEDLKKVEGKATEINLQLELNIVWSKS